MWDLGWSDLFENTVDRYWDTTAFERVIAAERVELARLQEVRDAA